MDTLSDREIEAAVSKLDVAWTHIPGQGVVRVFATASFAAGLSLVAHIGEIAQQANHHPEITLRSDEVEITLITHDAGGITQKDVDLAAQIDQME